MMKNYEGNKHNYVVEADQRKQMNEVAGLITGNGEDCRNGNACV